LTELTAKQRYLVQVVRQDLVYLRDEWDQDIGDDSLRRSSNVLRNLLVEDQFGKGWRSLGFEKQPVIKAPDLLSIIEELNQTKIMLAQAGGALHHGMKVMGMVQGKYVLSPEQIRRRAKRGPFTLEKDYYLSEYLNSPCLVLNGEFVKRRHVIQYVANKLGGVHLDFKRDSSNDLERKFIILDSIPSNIEIAEKKIIYLELLSIGQCVAHAADTEKFIAFAGL
jgi:hypothetical protein